MAQNAENKLAHTTNLALDHYSGTNIPNIHSRKDGNDVKLIKSDFTPELRPIDPKFKQPAPGLQRPQPPIYHPPPPPLQQQQERNQPLVPPQNPNYNKSSNQSSNQAIPNSNPNLNNVPHLQNPLPNYSQPRPLDGPPQPPFLPGEYKFYSTVRCALLQNYPRTGFEKLMMGTTLTMRPIFNMDEQNQRSCMQKVSTFYIYPGTHSREHFSMEPMFIVRENTNTCSKLCLTTDCRPFEILVSHDFEGKQEFLHLQRECNFNCFCMGRPEMLIDYTEEGTKHTFEMGGIFHPFVCCDYELEAFNNQGQTLFVITAQRCACNIYCCFGCDSCNKSIFTIKDLYNNTIGTIEIGTHYQSCVPGTHECDYFCLNFAPYIGPKERILLLSAMIFISTRLFSRGFSPQIILD